MRHDPALENLRDLLDNKCVPFSWQDPASYQNLIDHIGDARIVLLGEATHGTYEFYQIRAQLSQTLITQKGFRAIAIEGDWPDAYGVDRYLKGIGDTHHPEDALSHFTRFPTWMWRNKTLLPFIQWCRSQNDKRLPTDPKIGFYGLDLYSLQASMEAVIAYLQEVDPVAAKRAQLRYACFDHLGIDPETYGYLTSSGIKESCIREATEQLRELQQSTIQRLDQDNISDREKLFYATQNALLVKNAEHYYREHFEGRVSSWNIRDSHMAETLRMLADHLESLHEEPAKIIVWAHNSHIGDARATEMGDQGEHNIGQLLREIYDKDCYSIGFSTYEGTVTAATEWGDPPQRKHIKPGMPGSYEALFHEMKHSNFILHFGGDETLAYYLHLERLQRAIGVLYRPETERASHYFFTRLPNQFDSIIHIDRTTALEPLDKGTTWIQDLP